MSKKTSVASKDVPADNIPSPSDGYYEIEAIHQKRVCEGKVEYLVKWFLWDERYNSWEPEENLACTPDIVEAFEKSLREQKDQKRKSKHGDSSSLKKAKDAGGDGSSLKKAKDAGSDGSRLKKAKDAGGDDSSLKKAKDAGGDGSSLGKAKDAGGDGSILGKAKDADDDNRSVNALEEATV